MSLKIDQDYGRFCNIVRGKIREGLRKYISQEDMIGRWGKDFESTSSPQNARFTLEGWHSQGVGQGQREVGDALSGSPRGNRSGKAGKGEEQMLEVGITLDEFADILGHELEPPAVENEGQSKISSSKDRPRGIRNDGPAALRRFERSHGESVRRAIASGTDDDEARPLVPQRLDERYRSWRETTEPAANALVIYMIDVSGSMGDEQKDIVRIGASSSDTWLRHQSCSRSHQVVHEAVLPEVEGEPSPRLQELGSTSASRLAGSLIHRDYPQKQWNTYPFHLADGNNRSSGGTLAHTPCTARRMSRRLGHEGGYQ